MKKTIIIFLLLVSINSFAQKREGLILYTNCEKQSFDDNKAISEMIPRRRISSIYVNNETGNFMYVPLEQFTVRGIVIPKNTLPRKSPMVFKRDTIIVKAWGWRTETFYQMPDHLIELH